MVEVGESRTPEIRESRMDLHLDEDHLAAVYTTPEHRKAKSLAIMLHGGPGGQKDGPESLYSELAVILAKSEIASLRFDFRGVGESSGRYRDMTLARSTTEYEAMWSLAHSWGFDRIGVIGESYGATIALHSKRAKPDAVCLLWPAIYFLDGTFTPFVTDEKMAGARRDGFTVEDGVEVGLPFLEEVFEVSDVEQGIRNLTVPTLLIHGTADHEVPFTQSQRAYGLLNEPKKLVLVEDADHCAVRTSERTVVYAEVLAWLKEHLSKQAL